MWALPNIHQMNAGAKSRSHKAQIRRALQHPETVECEDCASLCTAEGRVVEPYYDVFSDDPKGVVARCERCVNDHGSSPEGYFTCAACERLFIENYTWERYAAYIDDMGEVCLNCYRDWYLADPEHWIDLTQPIDEDRALDFATIRRAPHLLAVGMDTPKTLRKIGSVTVDSTSGGKVRGAMSSDPTPVYGLMELTELLREARRKGASRAVLILDAAWQFAVDVGVYIDRPLRKRPTHPAPSGA